MPKLLREEDFDLQAMISMIQLKGGNQIDVLFLLLRDIIRNVNDIFMDIYNELNKSLDKSVVINGDEDVIFLDDMMVRRDNEIDDKFYKLFIDNVKKVDNIMVYYETFRRAKRVDSNLITLIQTLIMRNIYFYTYESAENRDVLTVRGLIKFTREQSPVVTNEILENLRVENYLNSERIMRVCEVVDSRDTAFVTHLIFQAVFDEMFDLALVATLDNKNISETTDNNKNV